MGSLFQKVQKKMTITAHRKVRTALEGEYASVFKGRSMDFDDLRPYVPNDDIKDVDWKATARSGQILIKRYVAVRKYNILLVVDTGRSMAATAPSGELKRDIALIAAGVIASVAQKHGDPVGMVAGDSRQVDFMPLKETRPHVERMLQYIDSHTTLDAAPSSLASLLEYVKKTVKKRMMLIMISDNLQFAEAQEQLLRRLGAQHELMFMAVDDLNPDDPVWQDYEVFDVESPGIIPKFLRSNAELDQSYRSYVQSAWKKTSQLLDHLQITSVRITSEDEVITQIIRMLERQKHAKR